MNGMSEMEYLANRLLDLVNGGTIVFHLGPDERAQDTAEPEPEVRSDFETHAPAPEPGDAEPFIPLLNTDHDYCEIPPRDPIGTVDRAVLEYVATEITIAKQEAVAESQRRTTMADTKWAADLAGAAARRETRADDCVAGMVGRQPEAEPEPEEMIDRTLARHVAGAIVQAGQRSASRQMRAEQLADIETFQPPAAAEPDEANGAARGPSPLAGASDVFTKLNELEEAIQEAYKRACPAAGPPN